MFRLQFGRVLLAIATAALVAVAAPAQAQEDLLLEDDFSTLDSALEFENFVTVQDNVLSIQRPANSLLRVEYQSILVENVDLTAKVRLADPTGETGAATGLIFWAKDYTDYYVVQISDSGTFCVARETPQRWLYPIAWRTTDALKTEPGEWNEVRVVAIGSHATITINGKEVGKIKGRAPEGGGVIGFYAEAGSEDTTLEYSELKAVAPPESAATADVEDPSVILADKFETLDPGWGAEQGWFGVKDGHMFVQFDPKQSYTALYRAEAVEDIDATVQVKANDGNDEAVSGGAITFWATDPNADFWQFELYDNGNIGVFRRVKDRWLTPIPVKAAPAEAASIPPGPMVVRRHQGPQGDVLHQRRRSWRDQRPAAQGGSFFGLFGERRRRSYGRVLRLGGEEAVALGRRTGKRRTRESWPARRDGPLRPVICCAP
jgi:hypothetical protein